MHTFISDRYIHPKKMDQECQFMSQPFKSRKYIHKDEFGNCVLGLPNPVPLEIVNSGEECGSHPSLSVKVVAMKEGDGYDSSNLQVYFSEDHGDTYYNEGNAHVATPRREDRRELLTFHEETQRKLCEECLSYTQCNQFSNIKVDCLPPLEEDDIRICQMLCEKQKKEGKECIGF